MNENDGIRQNSYEFNGVRGSLIFSTSKVELVLTNEETAIGTFEFEEQNGQIVEGYIYASSIRVQIDEPNISDNYKQVVFTFDAKGLKAGESLKGNFFVVTNVGEYSVPFVVLRQRNEIESSLGAIKNLFHFTNLAKSEWNEAVNVFYNPNFANIMTGNDAKYINLYRGLAKKGNKNHNLEEFLIGINKKQKIEYLVDRENIHIDNPAVDIMQTIKIQRNGWGYTALSATAIGDFIELKKTVIGENDFDNNTCYFEFNILTEKLHGGKNPGRIVLKTQYEEICVDIVVDMTSFGKKVTSHKQKSTTFALMRHYMDYTAKKITMNKWLMLSEELLGHRGNLGTDDLANNLMKVHLLLVQERFNEAKWVLDKRIMNNDIENESNEIYCYYLYLGAVYNGDDYYTDEITEKIRSVYEKDRANWRVAWILMKLDEEMRKNVSKRLAFVIEQVRLGCISPIMYLEGLKALSERPSLLIRLDEEEKRIILFGAREGILTDDLMAQVSYLIMKAKNYDPMLLRIIKLIYAKNSSDEALQSICVQLMKAGKLGTEYFEWYQKAVERNFPLTRLYESYMMSMDLRKDEPIPKRVLMYFSYQSSLPWVQNAYLYAYIVKNKEILQEMYLTYKETIDRFVLKQLYAGNINKDLAYLYTNIILNEMLTKDNIEQLAKILFIHSISVYDDNIANIVVVDSRLKEEHVYPVSGKQANVALLGNDYTVLLEDFSGNRFYTTKEYDTEKFFMPGRMMLKLENNATDNLFLNLFMCEENADFLIITDQTVDRYKYIEASDEVAAEYRGNLRLPLIRYYMEKDDTEKVDEILTNIGNDDVTYKSYNELVRIMIIRGMHDRALDFVMYQDCENIDPKILLRLAGAIIDRDGFVENDAITFIINSAFERGKYDVAGMTYLAKFAKGPIKKLRNVWKAATNFYVDTYDICEKMIVQTIRTGAYIGEEASVLRQYVEGGAKADVEVKYVAYFAHESFVNGRLVDDFIFSEMERLYVVEGNIPDICMMAWLQHMAGVLADEDISETRKNTICEMLRYLIVKKKIVFPFFGVFKNISPNAANINNQVLVEYRGTPGIKTVINYVITKNNEETGGFSREDMIDMYGGVYVKAFHLFFGETLQYYITEETDRGAQLTVSAEYSRNDAVGESGDDRYSIINDVAIANTLKDYDTTVKLLEEYKYKEYLVNSLFIPQ